MSAHPIVVASIDAAGVRFKNTETYSHYRCGCVVDDATLSDGTFCPYHEGMQDGIDELLSAAAERRSGPRQGSEERRWSYAINDILNSGTFAGYVDDFFKFIDGKLTYAEWHERRPT